MLSALLDREPVDPDRWRTCSTIRRPGLCSWISSALRFVLHADTEGAAPAPRLACRVVGLRGPVIPAIAAALVLLVARRRGRPALRAGRRRCATGADTRRPARAGERWAMTSESRRCWRDGLLAVSALVVGAQGPPPRTMPEVKPRVSFYVTGSYGGGSTGAIVLGTKDWYETLMFVGDTGDRNICMGGTTGSRVGTAVLPSGQRPVLMWRIAVKLEAFDGAAAAIGVRWRRDGRRRRHSAGRSHSRASSPGRCPMARPARSISCARRQRRSPSATRWASR